MMSEHYQTFHAVLKKLSVTTVQFSNKYILAGIGGDLCVFNSSESIQLQTRINVIDSVIHGISQNIQISAICVYGGKCIALLSADFSSSNSWLKCVHKWSVPDWVLCCKWVESQAQIAVLFSHNVLSLWDPYTVTNLAQVACAEKCILYSATVLSGEWTDTVVIGGTVFQQIIIWAVIDNSPDDRPVIHKLHGHKGVVFSVTYDKRSQLISSTSDDRTIRVWSVVSSKHDLCTAEDWRNAVINLSFTIFGHTARVWQSYILENKKIVSIGEDSLLCVWQPSGESVSHWDTHQGAGIWCFDVSESQSLIVTGGADGGISLWPLNTEPTVCHRLPPPADSPRRVAWLKGDQIIVVTEAGRLMLFANQTWSTVFTDSRVSNYCLLEVSPSRQFIGLASIYGHILILDIGFTKVVDVKVADGRIYSLHWLSEDTLLSCHCQGNLSVWRLHSSGLEELGKVYLPVCKERWTTAAVMSGATVVYGDRAGNIHFSPIALPNSNNSETVKTVSQAHSRLGVSSLVVLDGHVWSTGRDGIVKQFVVSAHSPILVSCSKLPLDWAAQIVLTRLWGSIVLCFHESNVVLWSTQERRKLTSLQCGGGHRSWSCLIDADQFCFTFLKNKTAHILQCPLFHIARPVLMDGFHVKEINCLIHIRDGWFASGGEDGTVRVSNFADATWTTPVVEQNHLSSVRSMQVTTFKQQTLLFSGGGRAQIKVWKINFNSPTSLTEMNSLMLRDENRGGHWLNAAPLSDPDTRYMDLHMIPGPDSSFLYVIAACSDAFLRIFLFDLKSYKLHLHKSVRCSRHCILRVTSFQCKENLTVTVSTATDGSVTFWNMSDTEEDIKAFACEYLHQSGVNGLSVSRVGLPADRVMIATGGDDNNLAVCCYHIDSPQLSAVKVTSWTSATLHSSVITGVQFVGEEWIVCSGGDQRVTLLSWSLCGDHLSVGVLVQCCCSVPDVKGLAVLNAERDKFTICVYGVGVEVLELKPKEEVPTK